MSGKGGGKAPSAGPNLERDFRGEKRSNATHRSRTISRRVALPQGGGGQPAKLRYLGHPPSENRNGLIVDADKLTQATGWAERAAAEAIIEAVAPAGRVTLGADKAYDVAGHVANLRLARRHPHVARTTRAAAAPPSTAVPPGTRATPSASASANGSRNHSAGSSPLLASARQNIAAATASADVHPQSRRLQPDPPAQALGRNLNL